MKNKISRREMTLLVIVLIAIVLALTYFYYYKPLLADIDSMQHEKQQKEVEYKALEDRINQIAEMERQADQTDEELKRIAQRFYPELGLGEYILKVNAMAKALGIDLKLLSFEKADPLAEDTSAVIGQEAPILPDGLVVVKFQLSFACRYDQYENFLEMLKDNERTIIGTQLEMGGQGDGLYQCIMTIEFCELKGMDEYVTPDEVLLPEGVVDRRVDVKSPFVK